VYYEDVLVATETAFEKKRNIAEGNIEAVTRAKKNVRIKSTGISGWGASALFYRHIRESFRANRFGLWGLSTLVLVVCAIAYGYICSQLPPDGNSMLFTMLMMLMWLQFFLVGTGRGIKDTYSHYIFLIPESPFKKMLWSNLETLLKTSVQNILIFIPAGLIMGCEIPLILACITTCTLFHCSLLAVNLFSMRFLGSQMNEGVLIILYFLVMLAVMLPGIVGAVVAGILIEGWGLMAALMILSVWELIATLVCFAASKGIMHNCDMPVLRQLGQ